MLVVSIAGHLGHIVILVAPSKKDIVELEKQNTQQRRSRDGSTFPVKKSETIWSSSRKQAIGAGK